MPKSGDLLYNCKSKFLKTLRSWISKQDKRFQVRLVRSTSGVQSNTIRFPGKSETVATLPAGWDSAHAIRLGNKPFAELGANSEALSGSQVDSPCSLPSDPRIGPGNVAIVSKIWPFQTARGARTDRFWGSGPLAAIQVAKSWPRSTRRSRIEYREPVTHVPERLLPMSPVRTRGWGEGS